MNLRERVTHTPPPNMNNAAHFGFEIQADVTRSPKQEYQWPHKKDSCPPKIKKRKKVVLTNDARF